MLAGPHRRRRGHLPGAAARRARDGAPGVRVYESHGELLEKEAGRIDFVDITTPLLRPRRDRHHAALDRGLHELCEKPLTTTTAEARALLDHARRAKRVLFPCHNYKHAPVIKTVRGILDAGTIGNGPRCVTLHTFRTTPAPRRLRVAPRLAARASLLRRRHRHGPREPHLLLGL